LGLTLSFGYSEVPAAALQGVLVEGGAAGGYQSGPLAAAAQPQQTAPMNYTIAAVPEQTQQLPQQQQAARPASGSYPVVGAMPLAVPVQGAAAPASWACARCTFTNSAAAATCGMCSGSR
jgi:hypothetical protein